MSTQSTRQQINIEAELLEAKSQVITHPYIYATGSTTDATPTDIAKIPLTEKTVVGIIVHVIAREVADSSTEHGFWNKQALFYRDLSGNATLQGSVQSIGTDIETTGTMDVTLEADTTAQTADVKVTGVAATTLEWRVKIETVRISPTEYNIEE
jgi:hypothetical protein